MSKMILALAGAAALAMSYPALAASSPDTTSVNVSLAGLDLAAPAGVSAAHQRVAAAVQSICGDRFAGPGLERRAAYDRCMRSITTTPMPRAQASTQAPAHES